jgi:hypothetical protein
LEHQRGQSFNVDDLKAASDRRQYLRSEYAPGKITIREILDREWEIICLAQDGKWKHPAFTGTNLAA